MKPISAVTHKSGFVVVGDDGSVNLYHAKKERWVKLAAVPGSQAAGERSKEVKKLSKKVRPECDPETE